jgi:hypothetical protein
MHPYSYIGDLMEVANYIGYMLGTTTKEVRPGVIHISPPARLQRSCLECFALHAPWQAPGVKYIGGTLPLWEVYVAGDLYVVYNLCWTPHPSSPHLWLKVRGPWVGVYTLDELDELVAHLGQEPSIKGFWDMHKL